MFLGLSVLAAIVLQKEVLNSSQFPASCQLGSERIGCCDILSAKRVSLGTDHFALCLRCGKHTRV